MSCDRESLSPSSPTDFEDYLFNDDDKKLLSSLLDTSEDLAVVHDEEEVERCLDLEAEEADDERKPPAVPRPSVHPTGATTLREQDINDDFALACRLQIVEDDGCTTKLMDHPVDFVTTGTVGGKKSDLLDFRLALQLQGEENEASMLSSYAGQAWKFVEELFQLYGRHEASNAPGFSGLVAPIGRDDLVFVAERFFETVEMFQQQGKPCKVDLGYHYTRSGNLDRIRTDGLLSRNERESSNIAAPFNGSTFGDGIYTAKNPFAFHGRYGDVGLVTARLHGYVGPPHSALPCDSIQIRNGQRKEFTVLKTCGQCLPIFSFKSALVMPHREEHPGNVVLFRLHEDLQSLLDYFINKAPIGRRKGFGQPSVPEAPTLNPMDPFGGSAADTWADNALVMFGYPTDQVPSGPMNVPRREATSNAESSHLVSPLSLDRNRVVLPTYHPPAGPVHGIKAVYPARDYTLPSSHFNVEQRPTTRSQAFEGKRPPEFLFVEPTPLKKPRACVHFDFEEQAIGAEAVNAAKADSNNTCCDQKLADDHLFRHVRECTFSKLSEMCTICSETLMIKKNGKMVQLHRCGHYFHENCLRTSLKQSQYCPSCNVSLDAKPASLHR